MIHSFHANYLLKKNKYSCSSNFNMQKVHSSFICNIPKLETTQMFTGEQINKKYISIQ